MHGDVDTEIGSEMLVGQRRRRSGITGGAPSRTASALVTRTELSQPERQRAGDGEDEGAAGAGHELVHSRLAVRWCEGHLGAGGKMRPGHVW